MPINRTLLLLAACLCADVLAQPAPRIRTVTELIAVPGPVLAASTQPAKVTTAPMTQPAGRDWYVSATPSAGADGLTPITPTDQWTAAGRSHGSDRIHLERGGTFKYIQLNKQTTGITVDSYGSGVLKPTIDAPGCLLVPQCGGTVLIEGIHFSDSSRNPAIAGFKPHVGGLGLIIQDCADAQVTVSDCDFDFGAFGMQATCPNVRRMQHGIVIQRCNFRNIWGYNQRSEGIYLEYQANALIEDCSFVTVGWYPGVQAANNQNHGVYLHGGDASTCSRPSILRCRFEDCAAEGPTMNADDGGTIDHCLIVNCGHDGVGMNAFLSGSDCTFTNNALVNGFVNFIAKGGTVAGNSFFSCSNLMVNVDAPAKQPTWTRAGSTVTVTGNVGWDSTATVLHVTDARGGTIPPGNNPVFTGGEAVRDAVIAEAGK